MILTRSRLVRISKIGVAGSVFYAISFIVIFNLAKAAPVFDRESDNDGIPIAAGPMPRKWVVEASYHGMFYRGNEWPFVVYNIPCRLWCFLNGFVKN